jgi:PAS domain S-box-containing protein
MDTKDRFQKLFELLPISCIITTIKDKVIVAANNKFINSLGYEDREVVGKITLDINFWGPETQRSVIEKLHDNNIVEDVEVSVFTCNGEERRGLVSMGSFCFKNEDYYIITFIDTTASQTMEKRMLDAIVKAEEKERSRISHELHDGLGPIVSIIKLHLQLLKNSDNTASKEQIIAYTEKTVEEALTTLKEISYQLSPHILLNYGLISAIKSFTDRIAETNVVSFRITHNFYERLEEIIEVTLYRVLIECINNALKHAKAQNIYISLQKMNNALEVEYADDGIGFEQEEIMKQHNGLGLRNIQNRIKTIGGSITIESVINKGVKISMKILL